MSEDEKRMLVMITDPIGASEITGEPFAHMMHTVTGYPNDVAVDLVKAGVAEPIVVTEPEASGDE